MTYMLHVLRLLGALCVLCRSDKQLCAWVSGFIGFTRILRHLVRVEASWLARRGRTWQASGLGLKGPGGYATLQVLPVTHHRHSVTSLLLPHTHSCLLFTLLLLLLLLLLCTAEACQVLPES